MACLEALVLRERRFGVVGALHVDPDGPIAVEHRDLRETIHVLLHLGQVHVHAQLSWLDADLPFQAALVELLDQPLVVLRDFVVLLGPCDVFAESSQEHREAVRLEF